MAGEQHTAPRAAAQVRDEEAYARVQQLVETSAADFWAPIAQRALHWFDARRGAWLHRAGAGWSGWDGRSGARVVSHEEWTPWEACVDAADSPVVRWYAGGLTNAAFNEVDRFVLLSHGGACAFIGEATGERTTLRQLLLESVVAAAALRGEWGLSAGQRMAVYLPNDVRGVVWIEAAKRAAVPYVAVASGTSAESLADRLADTAASLLVTSDALLRVAADAAARVAPPPRGVVSPAAIALPEGWAAAAPALHRARVRLLAELEADARRMAAFWSISAPAPVDATYPLFVLYTSGSTGKPKGIVHTHGGYLVGVGLTCETVFALQPARDVLFVIATAGWITGQSYMISAALLAGVPSVLLDGSAVSPPGRFAATVSRHRVSVLKAGSTFLRMLMTMPSADALLAQHDLSSLRLGTFCAEPVNEAVHRFAAAHLTPTYINSYWATEHGGIVWSRCFANEAQPLTPDTATWPLPWIAGAVLCRRGDEWGAAACGERGETVIRRRFPYQALTVWTSAGFGEAAWRGDVARWRSYFAAGVGFVQGDTAAVREDGAFTFHGRSDEVINVGGHRIGTAEIESALLADAEHAGSALRNCVVVGCPDAVLGAAPVAFVVLREAEGRRGALDEGRLRQRVLERLGPVAVPVRFVVATGLPETYSGKIMRGVLQRMLAGEPLGDLNASRNPECVPALLAAVRAGDAADGGVEAAAAADGAAGGEGVTEESLRRLVGEVVRNLLGAVHVSPSAPLMEAGIDSLSVTHLVTELSRRTGVSLSSTLIFEHPTADAIVAHLLARTRPPPSPADAIRRFHARDARDLAAAAAARRGRRGGVPPAVSAVSGVWPCGAPSSAALRKMADAAFDAASGGGAPARWGGEAEGAASHVAAIASVQLFDARAFGLTPAEAAAIDPQQRLLLEHCAAAHEAARLPRGACVGALVAIGHTDFADAAARGGVDRGGVGAGRALAAGRVAFALDLHGPCAAIDTACSSALVALHAAAACVAAAQCAHALAAAVNLVLSPHASAAYARAGMLSPRGRCRTFDARADGYVRGEGVGAASVGGGGGGVWALEGSAVRQDGRSASLTAPNGSAQAALLEEAAARTAACGGMCAVEAHGTGTPLGDPTEVRALARAATRGECALGGVKACVGHLEAAAGMAGLAKAAGGVRARAASPNAQLRVLNPHAAAAASAPLAFAAATSALPHGGAAAAGVSSFGYSGTIAHAVLSSPAAAAEAAAPPPPSFRRLRRAAFARSRRTS
ncbi:hypothetical protein AB1Y20_020978 [Prymnesium parvum]|uniref:acetate--CoA ligase n=1 Tax=Prymnesium parvum TaxID=97485 RepID=A0AB34JHF0_PRYPA